MKILGKIFSKYAGTRDLDALSIVNLQRHLSLLETTCAPINNGKLSCTPKFHILFNHVVEYLCTNRSWTKMSEQGIESLHAYINRMGRRFNSIRSREIRWRAIVKEVTLATVLLDTRAD